MQTPAFKPFGRAERRCLEFWRARLAGLAAEEPLLPRRSVAAAAGPECVEATLGNAQTERLLGFAGGSDFLVYVSLAVALRVCARRYSGRDLLIAGSPLRLDESGRGRVGLLPVPARIVRGDSVAGALDRVRRGLIEAYEHQAFVADGALDLVGVALRFDRIHAPLPELPGALVVEAQLRDGELRLVARGPAGGWDSELAAGFLRHVLRVASAFSAHADSVLRDLPMLDDDERRRIVVEWNDTGGAQAPAECLHQLFERQAVATPDAPAITFRDESWTYARLAARAEQLAARLRRRGVGPEVVVGVALERTPDLVALLLAIWKAGGAYLPIDPNNPAARIGQILADCRPALLLVAAERREDVPPGHMAAEQVLSVEDIDADEGDGRAPVAGPRVGPRNLAYVIATSGTTGRPKGVMVEHRGVCNMAARQRSLFGAGPGDVVLQVASISFDASVFEILMALAGGATLRLEAAETLAAAGSGVTHATLTPSILSALAEPRLATVRTLVVAGEECGAALVSRWAPRRRMFNAYGPTEASIWSTVAECDSAGASKPPIGRPIGGTQAYVLDEEFDPVPVGVVGELYIGGAGLARGYVGRADLTAERFVPDVFGGEGGRLYRTGDLARFLSDGNLEFLGRRDHQVKVRGYRIELGEIEAVLREHGGVREAVVEAREDVPGEKRLVGYVVPREAGRGPSASELRAHVKERLPEYMVPSAWVELTELPRTAHGKLDRKALPVPATAGVERRGYEEPRTEVERTLCRIWEEVLRVPRVGVRDNFFELGGDSILSIQIVSRARAEGLQLVVKQLFQRQTVAELAEVAEPVGAAEGVEAGVVTGRVELTPIQRWFFEQEWAEPWHFNQSVLLESRESVSEAGLRAVVSELLKHHDALRTCYRRVDGEWEQEIVETAGEAVVVESVADSSELERRCAEWQTRFDLERGPLLRVVLFRMSGQRDRVLLVAHHLVVDGVSWRVLLEDVERGYAQWSRGEALELGAKTASFKRWSERLKEHAASEAVQAQWEYWERQCAHAEADDAVRDEAATEVGALSVTLGAEETRALLTEVPGAYGTRINDALLLALTEAAGSELEGGARRGLRVELEGHGREESVGLDVSRTVGWFTTQYPLWLEVEAGADVGARLKAVKERLRQVPDAGLGYGLLKSWGGDEERARQLEPGRRGISFNYLGQLDAVLPSDGLFQPAAERMGNPRGEASRAPFALTIDGSVAAGCLHLVWTYREEAWSAAQVSRMSARCLDSLREIVAHCRQPRAGGYTPSDFPLARLDQNELDRLFPGPRQIEDVYTLAPLQVGILFHALFDPASPAYHAQLSCRVEVVDLDLWLRVLGGITQRHAVLRTRFVWESLSEPHQVVQRSAVLPVELLDWRALPAAEQERRFDDLRAADLARRFDLMTAPLMRVHVVREADERVRCLWSFQHLLIDGWSGARLLAEVLTTYAARLHGREPDLPAAEPYRRYVEWQRRQDLTAAEAHWRERLAGYVEPATLPEAEEAPAAEAAPFESAHLRLDAARTERLRRFAATHAASLGSLFQVAWALALARRTGRRDVVFGLTVSGRTPEVPGIDRMIGLLINTLPVRVRLEPGRTLGELLLDVQGASAEAQTFSFTPLHAISQWAEVPQGARLFETILVLENYPAPPTAASVQVLETSFRNQTTFPLTLEVQAGAEVAARATFDPRRFDRACVESLLAAFEHALDATVSDPSRRVGAIRALGEEEWGRQVVGWNATGVAFDGSVSLAEAIERQCARTPRATAVVGSDGRLSFAELDARAARLASRLRASGVARGGFVGLCVERDARVVVGVLGILKAGAAYVPIEPGSPRERVGYVVRDAGLRVVVSTPGSRGTVDHPGVEVVGLEDEGGVPCECVATVAGDAAYVLYTSGSTGQPKGVVVEQGAVWNYIRGIEARLGLEAGESWAMVQPLSVDSSVTALYPGLVSGGTVHVIGPEIALDGAALDAYLTREDVACLKIAPSHLMALQREARVMPSRRLVFGGEGAQPQWAAELAQRRAGCRVWNHYGPTETTVGVTTYEVQAGAAPRRGATVPIGRPLPNSRTYLLDEEFDPVPVGVVGELYIGGAGLARGYVGRADLTAERFVPDVFGGEGGRLYRTGDLARFLSDGNLEFLGRRDHQVKVRGYRIELGEIEAVLREHGGVREAVVEAREDVPGEKRLVGYVVPREAGRGPSASELRAHVKERLPEYMVPSAWVELGELPRTAHGKLDRKALPVPATAGVERRGYEEPRTEVERTLCRIWEEVLRVPRVGVRDNFFELGGDSILSIQIVSRARAEGLQLVVKQLFQRQTVAELAEVAEPVGAAEGVEAGVVTGRVELTPIQRWFFEQEWAEPWHFNQSVLLESRESVSEAGLRAVVSELLKHHDALRTCYRRVDGEWEQEIVETAGEAVVVESVAGSSELERRCAEWQTRFDLERGPLLRVVLFRMSGQRDRVLLVAHHLVVDGVSWRVLLEDVERGYARWSRGEALELGAKTASFKRWSERLKEHAASEAVQAQWEYWERQCAHGEGAVPGFEAEEAGADGVGVVSVRLDEDATRALLSEVPGVYGTRINDVLLLGLVEAAGVETEAGAGRGVRVELEGHGREESVGLDVSRTVGWFTTQYPLWLEVQAGADIGSKLKAVKEQVRQVPEAGLGYGLLKYWGGDEERARRLEPGRGGISFNYLGQLDAVLPSDGLLALAAESPGATESPSAVRPVSAKINAWVLHGRLHTAWSYRRCDWTHAAATRAAERLLDALRAVIGHCRQAGVGGFTPSDFPDMDFSQAELDGLAESLDAMAAGLDTDCS